MYERGDGELIIVRSWADLFALPGFIPDAVEKGAMKAGRLTARYAMSEKDGERACGLKDCRTRHRHGYVVRLPDGRYSHVGKDCGRNEFGAERWEIEQKRFRVLRARTAAAEALAEARANLATAIARPHVADQRVERRARFLLSAWGKAPQWLQEKVQSRAIDNDSKIVVERRETQAEANARRFRNTRDKDSVKGDAIPLWKKEEKGKLEGLRALRPNFRFDAIVDAKCVDACRTATDELHAEAATSKSLDDVRRNLESVRETAAQSARALEAFFEPENLMLLVGLPAARDRGIVRIALVGDAIVVD